MANTIGNVEEYSVIAFNPTTSETTTFQLNKNFTTNSNATFSNVKTASQSITNLTTETYSDTILKTNISVQEHFNEIIPDYSHFPNGTTYEVSAVKLPGSAEGYWGEYRLDIPTDFTDNAPEIKGITVYHSTAATTATTHLLAAIKKYYNILSNVKNLSIYLLFNYTTATTLNNIKLYVTLDNTTYTLTVNLNIHA